MALRCLLAFSRSLVSVANRAWRETDHSAARAGSVFRFDSRMLRRAWVASDSYRARLAYATSSWAASASSLRQLSRRSLVTRSLSTATDAACWAAASSAAYAVAATPAGTPSGTPPRRVTSGSSASLMPRAASSAARRCCSSLLTMPVASSRRC
jgi:hypothetical protein